MLVVYENLKWIRKKLKMSQNAFARMLDTNVSNVSRWENSKNGMSLETAFLISEKINIPLPDLVGIDFNSNEEYYMFLLSNKEKK